MAKAKLSKLIEELHGEIDGLVFREMPDGSIVVSKVPKRKKRNATSAQKEYRHEIFPDRVSWASTRRADPDDHAALHAGQAVQERDRQNQIQQELNVALI